MTHGLLNGLKERSRWESLYVIKGNNTEEGGEDTLFKVLQLLSERGYEPQQNPRHGTYGQNTQNRSQHASPYSASAHIPHHVAPRNPITCRAIQFCQITGGNGLRNRCHGPRRSSGTTRNFQKFQFAPPSRLGRGMILTGGQQTLITF